VTTSNFLRQLDILDPSLIVYPVTIIGTGGIGSPLAWILGKMGCADITLFDHDTVEQHNLPNQFFQLKDVGRPKVEAVRDNVLLFAECNVRALQEMYQNQPLSGIVISGVHDMKNRRAIWEKVRYNLEVPLYIDGRMGGEILELHTVRPSALSDIEQYEESLFSDEEAAELSCSARSIIYTVVVLGGLIASQVKKWVRKEKINNKITFDLTTMTFICDGKAL
jgi:sulfur carrier protein ThiS adenylyltransferase